MITIIFTNDSSSSGVSSHHHQRQATTGKWEHGHVTSIKRTESEPLPTTYIRNYRQPSSRFYLRQHPSPLSSPAWHRPTPLGSALVSAFPCFIRVTSSTHLLASALIFPPSAILAILAILAIITIITINHHHDQGPPPYTSPFSSAAIFPSASPTRTAAFDTTWAQDCPRPTHQPFQL
ncbi:hypothetical protein SODALDRAFT_357979 [Sodiomyces alkalinus F11]|uniref:Uncharacterized protein n=1 Tax=Sodiomyces alkalinus (strain CBS 110278 / VKM F-3762 / F11) TaxID=1314773 RepID=A0A3N2PYS4_SODAK|nr:hypothetical protein SODALDRAFT_357979 [Sodiomyces alkalinus F11]ROT39576.1 hypothetical protein SODALDRAFT_357979 [Sodiomyces alkalinus F11]